MSLKLQGALKLAEALAQDEQGAEVLLRACRTTDDDWRWVQKSRAIDCARALNLLRIINEWLPHVDQGDVQRMIRCATECSWRVASAYMEDNSGNPAS